MSHESASDNDQYGEVKRALQDVGGYTVTDPEGHEVGVFGNGSNDWLYLEHMDDYVKHAEEDSWTTEEFVRYMANNVANQPFEP